MAKPFRRQPDRDRHRPAAGTAWDQVASWYDRLVGEGGSDYHRHVILPAAMRMLAIRPGERVLDLACGQGVLARLLAREGASLVLGVDASPQLITAAKEHGGGANIRYAVGDARNLGALADGTFDAAACVMAVQDLDPVAPAMGEMARALRPGGRAVVIMMHPCFRIPRQSSWGWDEQKRTQYRRLDRYAAPLAIPIATHPGKAAGPGRRPTGTPDQADLHTTFFHRPLAEYFNALGQAGLAVVACEELYGHHTSAPGGHSRGENRARQEFPLFLALKTVKLPADTGGRDNAAPTT